MKRSTPSIRHRLRRRMLLVLIAGSAVPLVALAVQSYRQVTNQLRQEARERLSDGAKGQAMLLYERLATLQGDLEAVADSLRLREEGAGGDVAMPSHLASRFRHVARTFPDGATVDLLGKPDRHALLARSVPEVELGAASAGLFVSGRGTTAPTLFLELPLDAADPARGTVVGAVKEAFLLWGRNGEPDLGPLTDLALLDGRGEVLFSTLADPAPLVMALAPLVGTRHRGEQRWLAGEAEQIAGYWTMPVVAELRGPGWTVALSEPMDAATAAISEFRWTFVLTLLLAIWTVLLVIVSQVRRSLGPLEALGLGTRRIATGDFATRVDIATGDELQDLADSFNSMARRLGTQFATLKAMNDIVSGVLSALDPHRIIDELTRGLRDVSPSRTVSVTLFDGDGTCRTMLAGELGPTTHVLPAESSEVATLPPGSEVVVVAVSDALPSYLRPVAGEGVGQLGLLPLMLEGRTQGVIGLGFATETELREADLSQMRQLADQVEVALGNAKLIRDLEEMHQGTLKALATAIDASSPWTMGHSERVTELAMAIAQETGLPEAELRTMHRGGLLHDIGKVAIPAAILDKPAKLTWEEFEIMKSHVVVGARILEPIRAFHDVMPIVMEHHEWYNGQGYPRGLAGEQITLHGRIFAVADVYDALRSERPYRSAVAHDEVVEHIRRLAGEQFDPGVVTTFLEVADRWKPAAELVAPQCEPSAA